MRKLSKEDQVNLMWDWNSDPALHLIYRTFERFVEAKVGKYYTSKDT